MSGSKPSLSAADKRAQRERDSELMRERLKNARAEDARKRRRLGFSLLSGPGGEQGLSAPKLGASV